MAFVTWGGNYCIAQEKPYKTLSFPDENKANNEVQTYDKTWTAKIGDFSWRISRFNNNNWNNDWTYIKAGNKKVASQASIQNTTPFDRAIAKVVVDIEPINKQIEKVEKIKFEVASDANFQNIVEEKTIVSDFNNVENHTFVVKNPKVGQYFRLTFNLGKTANKLNGLITVNKVEYYEDVSNKTATSLSFDAPSYTISKDQKYQQLPNLKAGEETLSGKTITWSSDNENVAIVDKNGTVTGVAAGKANITAKFAGDDTYKTSTASYEIIVKGAPALSFPETSYTVEMGDAFSEPTLQGLPTDVTAKYSSSNADVATVDESTGKVQIVGVGTTTIKAVSEAKDVYEVAEASYVLTVKSATTKKVIFDFANQVDVSNIEEDGVCLKFEKADSQNEPYWNASGHIRFYKLSVMTITANSNIKNVEFEFVGSKIIKSAVANPGNYAAKVWNFSDVKAKTGTLKNSESVAQIKRIIVTTELPTSVGTISIATSEGFGTYYNSNSYILPEGLTAFGYKKANTDGTLVKTDVFNGGDVVPANAALVVKGNEGKYECYATDKVAMKTLEGNLLKGVTTDTRIEAKSGVKRYILTRADDGILAFYRTNSGTINVKANRAYLEVPTAMAVASFSLEGSATGINNVVTTAAKQGIYTISGVRLNATTTKELPAGIYIVDGKKVIVK